jgi:Acetyltransferase (GNAT) domain
MEFYFTDPLSDDRWNELVARQPRSSVFHQRGWLEALRRTYSYQPFVLTSAAPGNALTDGIVLCRVSSWITGTRAVSLPFADHCEPLVEGCDSPFEFTRRLRAECDGQRWDYVEVRPLSGGMNWNRDLPDACSYCFHTLDLEPTLEHIFCGLHKDSLQRRIRKAEREQLSYEAGRAEQLVNDFYRLLLRTRRRHQLVPQPRAWFRNLVDCLGDNLQISLARKNGEPIAALLTLRHKSTAVFKYGCSDERYHNLAGMPFLFWKFIEESKAHNIAEIDFGRSDLDNKGLITFKDRFGTRQRLLQYFRYSRVRRTEVSARNSRAIRKIFSVLPAAVLPAAGRMLYRHIG